MNYLSYVMMTGFAALAAALLCFAGLWLLAPALLARARRDEPREGGGAPAPVRPEPAPGLQSQDQETLLNFRPAQAPAIAAILEKEDPADIGLVLSQMPEASGGALLAALPEEKRAGAVLGLAALQAPDAELLRAIKGELESRLYLKTGGTAAAAALLKALPYGERKALLLKISALDGERGAELRALLPLADDLADMAEKDLAALASAVPPEKMGAYLPVLPEKLRARIKAAYAGKAAQALEKAEARGDAGKTPDAALDEFIGLVEKLSARGLIGRHAPKVKAPPAAPAPAAKDDWG